MYKNVYECSCVWPLGVHVSCDLFIYLCPDIGVCHFFDTIHSCVSLDIITQMLFLFFPHLLVPPRERVWSFYSLLSPPGRTRHLVSTSTHKMHGYLLLKALFKSVFKLHSCAIITFIKINYLHQTLSIKKTLYD